MPASAGRRISGRSKDCWSPMQTRLPGLSKRITPYLPQIACTLVQLAQYSCHHFGCFCGSLPQRTPKQTLLAGYPAHRSDATPVQHGPHLHEHRHRAHVHRVWLVTVCARSSTSNLPMGLHGHPIGGRHAGRQVGRKGCHRACHQDLLTRFPHSSNCLASSTCLKCTHLGCSDPLLWCASLSACVVRACTASGHLTATTFQGQDADTRREIGSLQRVRVYGQRLPCE